MTYFKSAEIGQVQDRALNLRFPAKRTARRWSGTLIRQPASRRAILAGQDADRAQAKQQFDTTSWDNVDKNLTELDEMAWVDFAIQSRPSGGSQEAFVGAPPIAGSGDDPRLRQQARCGHQGGRQFTEQATPMIDSIKRTIDTMSDSMVKLLGESKEELREDNRSLTLTMIGTTLAVLAIGIFVSIFVGRGIAAGIKREKLALDAMLADSVMLSKAAVEGKLETRADASRHQGTYAEIVLGLNGMLDAILLPIGEGNRILAQISNGKIDELIAQTYKGDHEKMKQAVNNIAIVVQSLQKEMARLTEASKDGQLSDRGKPEQFNGAYAEIVRGVNTMLDAILLPIGEGNRILGMIRGNLREKVEFACKGDHAKMKGAVNGVHAWLTELTAYATRSRTATCRPT